MTRLTREAVLRGAFAILDEYGLGDLTMRRLAGSLGVQPGGLYWHFANKQTLLAAMADEIVARVVDPDAAAEASDSDWREALTKITEDFRAALLSHRDGAELVAAGAALRPGTGEPLPSMIKIIQGSGLGETEADAAGSALLHYVLGHTAELQAHDQLLRAGGLPESSEPLPDPAVAFTIGREIFLDGLQHRLLS